jgi:hypothetical protein
MYCDYTGKKATLAQNVAFTLFAVMLFALAGIWLS